MSHRPYNIAHQGASGLCPPNTLAAFRRAWEIGADIIELDVTHTLDGVVVVSHDLTVDRCTDGHGYIPEMRLVQVKRLDAGIGFGEAFAGERIPTLEEVIDWAQQNSVRLCIEIKGDTLERYLKTAQATIHLLRRYHYLQLVTLTCFNADCIRAMKEQEPLLSWALDPDRSRPHTGWELCQQVLACGANFLLHEYQTLTAEIVDEIHQHGFAVWAWTVDDPGDMRCVIALGVDGIMTNRPDLLKAVQETWWAR